MSFVMPELSKEEERGCSALRRLRMPELKVLLSEEYLFKAGISHWRPLGDPESGIPLGRALPEETSAGTGLGRRKRLRRHSPSRSVTMIDRPSSGQETGAEAASTSPDEVSPGRPPPEAPPQEAMGGSVDKPADTSALSDWRVAQDQLAGFLLPADAANLKRKSPPFKRKEAFHSYIKLGHYLQDFTSQARSAQAGLSKASDTIRGLKKRAEGAEADVVRLQQEVSKVESSRNELEHELAELKSLHSIECDLRAQAENNLGQQRRELEAALEEEKKRAVEAYKVSSACLEATEERERKAVDAYKASTECHNAKVEFSVEAYDGGKLFVYQELKKRFPDLDLSFLDLEEDDEEAIKLPEEVPSDKLPRSPQSGGS